MTHIPLNNDLPGISGLMINRPDTAGPLNDLAGPCCGRPPRCPRASGS